MELNYFLNKPKYTFTLSREKLESLCNDFLQRIEKQITTIIKESNLSINRFLLVGNATKMPAIPLLVLKVINGEQGISKEGLNLLLNCYIQSGSREEYRNLVKRYAHILEMPLPDFTELNFFLRSVSPSVFLIRGTNLEGITISGSGFAISPDQVLTNRHVLQGVRENSIQLIGHETLFRAAEVILDSLNDIAVIRIEGTIHPSGWENLIF